MCPRPRATVLWSKTQVEQSLDPAAPTEPESGRDAGRASGELRLGTPPPLPGHHFLAQSAKLPLKAFPVWLPSPIYSAPRLTGTWQGHQVHPSASCSKPLFLRHSSAISPVANPTPVLGHRAVTPPAQQLLTQQGSCCGQAMSTCCTRTQAKLTPALAKAPSPHGYVLRREGRGLSDSLRSARKSVECLGDQFMGHRPTSAAVLKAPEAWAMLFPVHLAPFSSMPSPHCCSQNGTLLGPKPGPLHQDISLFQHRVQLRVEPQSRDSWPAAVSWNSGFHQDGLSVCGWVLPSKPSSGFMSLSCPGVTCGFESPCLCHDLHFSWPGGQL